MTFAELQQQLAMLSPEQLAIEVVWCGDERGGKVKSLWIADEDWIGYDGDCERRSEIAKVEPEAAGPDAHVYIAKGTPQLLVD